MAIRTYGLRAELEGLRLAMVDATVGAIVRTQITVHNREVDRIFTGPFPWIQVFPVDYDFARIAGSLKGGGVAAHPNIYSIAIWDQVDQVPNGGDGAIASSQDDVYDLIDAIVAYFLHKPHRCLPNRSATLAGERLRWRFDPLGMYRSSSSGVLIGAMGVITVQGVPQNEADV